MTLAVTASGPADLRAQRRLIELEGVIQGGLQTFTDVGQALLEIRDSRLYRFTGAGTFDAYCQTRWNLRHSRVNQLMDAAEISTMVEVENERQARELLPVMRSEGADAVREVWAVVNERTNGEPTAAVVRAVVQERQGNLAPMLSSETVEWYTPRHVLDAVTIALGSIDLDPCAETGKGVPATQHFTEADNGLGRPWHGRVFMNPPYGKTIGAWVDKLADEFDSGRVTEAIALVPARVETSWWAHLPASIVCFITGRLKFSEHENSAPFPNAVCYLGPNDRQFAEAFIGLGTLYVRLETAA